ncbi:uncharacterized protein LOC125072958 [Vanessa atalanta]|uniref:uncharacterized protein LOC125072958 n=1 Tax=Vanessa atalanta TaxID=42275 RepID=UPI001FCDC198|nr:uncharacterized protein LOC125072958 [Vanessa atalanta]
MDKIQILTQCEDDSCCCLSERSTAALISIICLMSCILDLVFSDKTLEPCCEMKDHLDSLKYVLLTLFKIANILLLLGAIFESSLLLQIYLWYLLGYIIVSFVVVIIDLCLRIENEGRWTFVTFVPDVVFLFVIFRCLPLVDYYKKHLEELQAI